MSGPGFFLRIQRGNRARVLVPILAGFICLFSVLGFTWWIATLPSQATEASDSADVADVHYTHDVGTLITGKVATHVFTISNPHRDAIKIQEEADLRKNCGCSEFTPSVRILEPGAEAKVKLTVHTDSLAGSFEKGGEIVWTTAGAEKWITRFSLRGVAVLPLQSSPASLVFSQEDLEKGEHKSLVIEAAVPVQWEGLTVSSSSPRFQVVGVQVRDGAGHCTIACSLPDDVEDLEGRIVIEAPAAAGGVKQEPLALYVPVSARHAIEVTCSPKSLNVDFSRSAQAEARLLLRGTTLATTKQPIESISSNACQVDWKLGTINDSGSTVLFLNLSRLNPAPSSENEALFLKLASGRMVRVPLTIVGEK